METYERRTEIWEKLRIRRKDTIANLAVEFGVSKQTIRRDIDALSREHHIYTLPGRYSGGIFVDEKTVNIKFFNEDELNIMRKLADSIKNRTVCILSNDEIITFNNLILKHTKPPPVHTKYVHKRDE